MMERLRRLRSSPTLQANTTTTQGKRQHPSTSADKANSASTSKSKPRYRQGGLDLEKLDSKLQQYVELRGQGDEDGVSDETDAPAAREPDRLPEKSSHHQTARAKDDTEAAAALATSTHERAVDAMASAGPGTDPQTRSHNGVIEIIVHPPPEHDPPEAAGPSDFDVFLRQAEEDERLRKEKGHATLPKPKQASQLNRFYSNQWTGPSQASPKLAEIRELGDEDGDGMIRDASTETDESSSSESSYAPKSAIQGKSSFVDSGSHDFAGTPEAKITYTQSNVIPAKPGRHVSFCEPVKTRDRSDSHPSAYHVRGYESPLVQRTVASRRSIRKMMTDYIRQL